MTRFVAQRLRSRVRLAISEKGLSPGLDASVRLGRTLARCLAEDFPAEGDSLDPALSTFGRLGLQRGWSTDRPPQTPALGVEARDQLQPALTRNPQLLQDRRFLSRDPPHFPGVRLAAGPLQQLQGLCAGRVQTPQIRYPGAGTACCNADSVMSAEPATSLARRTPLAAKLRSPLRTAGGTRRCERSVAGGSVERRSLGSGGHSPLDTEASGSRDGVRDGLAADSNFTRLSAVCRNGQSLPSRAGNDRTGLSQTTP